jgi:hypothetical protein
MADPKISSFIIGLAFVSLIIGIIILNLSSLITIYGAPDSYDNDSLSVYNKMSDLSAKTEKIRNSSNSISSQDLKFKDIVGGFFTSGYSAVIVSLESVDIFTTMSGNAVKDSNMGQSGSLIYNFLVIAILITIFVGILISALIKQRI